MKKWLKEMEDNTSYICDYYDYDDDGDELLVIELHDGVNKIIKLESYTYDREEREETWKNLKIFKSAIQDIMNRFTAEYPHLIDEELEAMKEDVFKDGCEEESTGVSGETTDSKENDTSSPGEYSYVF